MYRGFLTLAIFLCIAPPVLAACPDIHAIKQGGVTLQAQYAKTYVIDDCALRNHTTASQISDMFFTSPDIESHYAKAEPWLLKAAEQGDGQAQIRLGFMYAEKHFTGIENNLEKAEYWFTRAAGQNADGGRFRLGNFYHHYVRPPDYQKAYDWLKRAADENNDPSAQYDVSRLLRSGDLGTVDISLANSYLEQAAENGVRQAQIELAAAYETGENGLPKNKEKALYWAEKLANGPGRPLYWRQKVESLQGLE